MSPGGRRFSAGGQRFSEGYQESSTYQEIFYRNNKRCSQGAVRSDLYTINLVGAAAVGPICRLSPLLEGGGYHHPLRSQLQGEVPLVASRLCASSPTPQRQAQDGNDFAGQLVLWPTPGTPAVATR